MFDIVFENNTEFKPDLTLAKKIGNELDAGEVELILTDNAEIHEINLTTRGKDKPTDVLSFPYEQMPHTPVGSIVISYDFVKEYAHQFGHSLDEEFTLLFIHGLLHLLGFDHETDKGEHRKKEEELIKKYDLPHSLIIRNS